MGLTRDAILGASDLPSVNVAVPEWGGDLTLRCMSGAQRASYEDGLLTFQEKEKDKARAGVFAMASLLVACAVTDEGEPLFTSEDVPALMAKSYRVLARVYREAVKLNRIGKGDIEDLAGN